jgi:hypothetical protein
MNLEKLNADFGEMIGANTVGEAVGTQGGGLNSLFESIIKYVQDDFGIFHRIAGPREFFIIVFAALAMGIVMSVLYRYVTKSVKKSGSAATAAPSQNLAITLIILPVVIAAVVFLVGNNLAAAFSLAGVFSITRFRSAAANSKDLTFIFVSMAIGLASGTGFVAYGVAICTVLCIVLFGLSMANYGEAKSVPKILRINVPESLSFDGLFDPILTKYAENWAISRVKTVDLGAVYEISYSIAVKDGINEKEFVDELRTRNGNLNIVLVLDRRAGRNEM